MEWILALVLAVPIILFPTLLIWYLNAAGVYAVMRDRVRKRAAARRRAPVAVS